MEYVRLKNWRLLLTQLIVTAPVALATQRLGDCLIVWMTILGFAILYCLDSEMEAWVGWVLGCFATVTCVVTIKLAQEDPTTTRIAVAVGAALALTAGFAYMSAKKARDAGSKEEFWRLFLAALPPFGLLYGHWLVKAEDNGVRQQAPS